MKYIIAGLGNIGEEYSNTRHNIGFNVLDYLAQKNNTVFTLNRHAFTCSIKHKGRQLILVKPTTYMNLSGKAIKFWMDKEKVRIENILVVADDIALPYGKLRLKAKGSDGGHNGLKDIQKLLNSASYPRLRFGVGDTFSKGRQTDYVLGKWDITEAEHLEKHIENATEAILSFAYLGLQRTMNTFNQAS